MAAPTTLVATGGFGAPSVTVRGDGELRNEGAREAFARLARGAGTVAAI
ncbi:hypothetical protein [Cryobacterium mannosilyticum]|nr:hypothetical protein [Cryobacterium mannosilyticum]